MPMKLATVVNIVRAMSGVAPLKSAVAYTGSATAATPSESGIEDPQRLPEDVRA